MCVLYVKEGQFILMYVLNCVSKSTLYYILKSSLYYDNEYE